MAKWLKRLLAIVVVGSLFSGVVALAMLQSPPKEKNTRRGPPRNAPVPVLATAAVAADVPVYLEGIGSARPLKTVTVKPQIDGRIMAIAFKEGQDVKKGDVLARIDSITYQAQLDQALAKKALTAAQLANAKRDLERYMAVPKNVVAIKTIDTQRALIAQLTAQLKADEAAIASARAILDYTTIVAPIDGRTGIRQVDEGNIVRASGDQSIVVITQVKPISVLFTMPQQQLVDINRALARGAVKVTVFDADRRGILDEGVLQVVDNQVDQTTGTVRMKAEFANDKLQLWPGQFVNVRLLVEMLRQVTAVPTAAIQQGPTGTFVYVVGPGQTVALRPVTVSLQDDRQSVISKGVAPGDVLVTSGFNRLRDGSRVLVTRTEEQGTPGTATKPVAGDPGARKGRDPSKRGKGRGRRKQTEGG
ncbi:MAG: efflux RND transporter periplasmic adaptor subunit [Hyphomicrobiaceae bacterium]|nr:efflux RND transporter periplasmic adaptor subunit [Hyphomicrobiaceae bacterium]